MRNLTDYQITEHMELRLKQRFGMTYKEILERKKWFKRGSLQCRHKVVRSKLMRYSHQVCFYNEGLNMVVMCDTFTKDICSVLYLDGRDGYNFNR